MLRVFVAVFLEFSRNRLLGDEPLSCDSSFYGRFWGFRDGTA